MKGIALFSEAVSVGTRCWKFEICRDDYKKHGNRVLITGQYEGWEDNLYEWSGKMLLYQSTSSPLVNPFLSSILLILWERISQSKNGYSSGLESKILIRRKRVVCDNGLWLFPSFQSEQTIIHFDALSPILRRNVYDRKRFSGKQDWPKK